MTRHIVLALLAFCATASAADSPIGSLSSLAQIHDGVAKHEGSWDRTGGNADARQVPPGETITLLDYTGAGIIRRFWVTIAPRSHRDIHRQAVIRMYWDGSDIPAVECPIGDFFGVGFGEQRDYISLPLNETSGGYNCYWPMPFHKSAKWTLTNLSGAKIDAFYYNIDFTAYDKLPDDLLTFHVYWNRENPTLPNKNYTILDVKGFGHVAGVAMFMQARKPRGLGFLEGDEMVYIDGEEKPSFIGTGTEDYYSSGWYFDRGVYSAPFHGVVIKDELNSRISAYRWHIEDAIPFKKSIRFTIEHGHNNDHEADYSSVAYFYAKEGVSPPPNFPKDAKDLLPTPPPQAKHFPNVIEAEVLAERSKATGGQVTIQSMDPFVGEWSGSAQLFWIGAGQNESATLSIPVAKAGEYNLIAHFNQSAGLRDHQLPLERRPQQRSDRSV